MSLRSLSIHKIFADLKMATSYQIGFMKDGKIHPEVVEETKSCMYIQIEAINFVFVLIF